MEYLTQQELDQLATFLKTKRISHAEIGRSLGKTGAMGNYWFRKKRFKRLQARELVKILKERALEGFEDLNF